jgi:hypothetical protein
MYQLERHYTCKHSRRSRVSGFGSRSLAVYSTCKNPERLRTGKFYLIKDRVVCDSCDRYKARQTGGR